MMILVIDDDIAVRTSMKLLLKQAAFEVSAVADPDEALLWLRGNRPDLVLMDMNFSMATDGQDGLELLQKVRIFHPAVPVVLITGWGSIALAVEGMRLGAADFVTKPWDNDRLIATLRTAIQLAAPEENMVDASRRDLDALYDFSLLIGEAPEFLDMLSMAGRIASTRAAVLITGESGTGKELVAQGIHENSQRRDKPFIKVNLGAVPENLFESEMFGHKKGAFTDAQSDRKGRFELADGGTLFLDEIGELPLTSQVKLLRVLQEQQYERLGDSVTRKMDVRIVCATNRNLAQMVAEKTFREDLFYRINIVSVALPPLRNRVNDIPLLARHFIRKVACENKLAIPVLQRDAVSWLKKYPFYGNIRELKNMVERTVLLSTSGVLNQAAFERHMPEMITVESAPVMRLATLESMEKEAIIRAMNEYKGNVSRVARTLGLSRGALYRRFDKFNIPYEA